MNAKGDSATTSDRSSGSRRIAPRPARGSTWPSRPRGRTVPLRPPRPLSRVRGPDGSYPLAYGTFVFPEGGAAHLDREAFDVEVVTTWTSPTTGATYPAGWVVSVPEEQLRIELTPTVADQELDTRATTGVVYWEGSQQVRATRGGRTLGGEAYVELTGYGPGVEVTPP